MIFLPTKAVISSLLSWKSRELVLKKPWKNLLIKLGLICPNIAVVIPKCLKRKHVLKKPSLLLPNIIKLASSATNQFVNTFFTNGISIALPSLSLKSAMLPHLVGPSLLSSKNVVLPSKNLTPPACSTVLKLICSVIA